MLRVGRGLAIGALLAAASLAVAACFVDIDESRIGATEPPPNGEDGGAGDAGDRDAGERDAADASTCVSAETGLCGDRCVDLATDPDHCGACDTPCSASQTCGGGKCIAPTSCKELLSLWPGAPTGPHSLLIDGARLPAYCDMTTDGGGFTLVFRVNAGLTGDPYTLFTNPPLNDDVPAEATPLPTQRHYVSRIVGRWNDPFQIDQVRARLLDPVGKTLTEITFAAAGTTRTGFFTKARVTASPWTDLAEASWFSVVGNTPEQRRFYIHAPFTNCAEDEGWLDVHAARNVEGVCAYERPTNVVRIYYANGPTKQRWHVAAPEAQAFVLFVR